MTKRKSGRSFLLKKNINNIQDFLGSYLKKYRKPLDLFDSIYNENACEKDNYKNILCYSINDNIKDLFDYILVKIGNLSLYFDKFSTNILILEATTCVNDYYFFEIIEKHHILISELPINILNHISSQKSCSTKIFNYLYKNNFKIYFTINSSVNIIEPWELLDVNHFDPKFWNIKDNDYTLSDTTKNITWINLESKNRFQYHFKNHVPLRENTIYLSIINKNIVLIKYITDNPILVEYLLNNNYFTDLLFELGIDEIIFKLIKSKKLSIIKSLRKSILYGNINVLEEIFVTIFERKKNIFKIYLDRIGDIINNTKTVTSNIEEVNKILVKYNINKLKNE